MSRKRTRSRAAQFNFAINENVKINISKRAENRNPTIDNSASLYSIQRIEDIRHRANDLSKFLDDKYPSQGKLLTQIKSEQVQEYVDYKSKTNGYNSICEILSQLRKLDTIVAHTFGHGGFSKELEMPLIERAKARDKTMSYEHIELIRQRFQLDNSKSQSRTAFEVSVRTGARIKEIARMHSSRIDIENQVIHTVEGAKNGRARDIPIRTRDLNFFKDLKENTASNYICGGVQEDSLNRGIRRCMDKIELEDGKTLADIYEKTTNHAIRKFYAQERMSEIRGTEPLEDKKEEMRAWDSVCQELGHGKGRENLYKTYCATKI